jgi:hypothetical protein
MASILDVKQRLAAIACMGLAATAAGADDAPFGIDEALAAGRFTLELRPRYNRIEESDKPEVTSGFTYRAIAGWRSAPFHGFKFTAEAINTDNIGAKHFNDDPSLIFSSPYPLLPDPDYSGVNRVHVEYANEEGLRLRIGRQLARLENQRWVSDNDFRQIPQLFDGAFLAYEGFTNVQLDAAYYNRVRNTSGMTQELKLSTLHAAWNPLPGHALAAYAVFHEQPQNGAFTGFADNSYRVVGVRAEGAMPWGSVEIPYVAEVAKQDRYAGGDSRIDARYWRVGAGLAGSSWVARYDYEVKGSNSGAYGLQTPLTDFYAFNGWTLRFYNTPAVGLRDGWLTAKYAYQAFTLYGEAHRFRADFGSASLGRELDVGLTWVIGGSLVARLQHARYDPGAGTADVSVRKTWLTLVYNWG